jgi:hypothetical protein
VGSFCAKIEHGGFVGLPVAKWDEFVHAVIVPQEGTPLKEDELSNWSRDRMAGYKRRYPISSGGDAAQGDRKNSAP